MFSLLDVTVHVAEFSHDHRYLRTQIHPISLAHAYTTNSTKNIRFFFFDSSIESKYTQYIIVI